VKIGILGGSFNPVHNGHLFLAEKVFSALKLDRIIFVPVYQSPFKLNNFSLENKMPSANDRLDMLGASLTGDDRFTIDNCEIKREGVSYTINTLEDIITRYNPSGKPVLIIGDDLAADFLKWHESVKILQLADIAVARRKDSAIEKYSFPCILVENEVMEVSSREIRQKIEEDNNWLSLVPLGVRQIIEERQLYGFKKTQQKKTAKPDDIQDYFTPINTITQAVIHRIEAAVRKNLNTERFLHSRSTAVLAADMCRKYGFDPLCGYLAGIAHDFAKQIDCKQLYKIVKSNKRYTISALEKSKLNLLHGKAAAVLLKERFCIHNEDVLEALAFHTSGSADMGTLAKIIYIADKIECTRNIDPAFRKMLNDDADIPLDLILFAIIEKTIVKLKAKELDLSKDTLLLLEKIKEK